MRHPIGPVKGAAAWSRRRFLGTAAGAGALAAAHALLPAWARGAAVPRAAATGDPRRFALTIADRPLDIAGGEGRGITINGTIPGPLLEWQEGRDVIIDVTNRLAEDTSIHWHGILLPFDMDGVPGVSFRGIAPGETFRYRFPVRQSGTYWYHSHSGLQEQSGVYGPLIIRPRGEDPVRADREYVLMLSDWTYEDPHDVLDNLRKQSDYYQRNRFSAAELYGDRRLPVAEAWRTKLAWDRMRMPPTDIADVTGATYTYLLNGLHPEGNWTGLFRPGERVRLRVINGSSMTYFNVRIPGLPMTIVAADGQNVEPVETDELQIAVAETCDVIVEPREDAYTIMAESMDRSGYAAGTLAVRAGLRAPVPALREPPLLTMLDMGMEHGADSAHAGAPVPAGSAGHDAQDSHAAHGQAGHDADGHGAVSMPSMYASPVVARHGPDRHGPGNAAVAELQRNRLGEPGTGLAGVPHRVFTYRDLRRLDDDFDTRPPARELELHLTGHMQRYLWSFDGKRFDEADGPIELARGERLRLTLVNDTMMNHPIHLHGMWLELENGQGCRIPRKHTVNVMPASRLSVLVNADPPGRWAFHCHLLYHMEMGMFRVVRVG